MHDTCEICPMPRRCGCYCGRHHQLVCVEGKSPRAAKLQTQAEDFAAQPRGPNAHHPEHGGVGDPAYLKRLAARGERDES